MSNERKDSRSDHADTVEGDIVNKKTRRSNVFENANGLGATIIENKSEMVSFNSIHCVGINPKIVDCTTIPVPTISDNFSDACSFPSTMKQRRKENEQMNCNYLKYQRDQNLNHRNDQPLHKVQHQVKFPPGSTALYDVAKNQQDGIRQHHDLQQLYRITGEVYAFPHDHGLLNHRSHQQPYLQTERQNQLKDQSRTEQLNLNRMEPHDDSSIGILPDSVIIQYWEQNERKEHSNQQQMLSQVQNFPSMKAFEYDNNAKRIGMDIANSSEASSIILDGVYNDGHFQVPHPPYRDFSNISDPNELVQLFDYQPNFNRDTFPVVLHNMIEICSSNARPIAHEDKTVADMRKLVAKVQETRGRIVCWNEHGRSFQICDRQGLTNYLLPIFFPSQKHYSSFHRQLNNYGFLRLTRSGPDDNSFYHPLFLRGIPELAGYIPRSRKPQSMTRERLDPSTEPDFLSIPPVNLTNIYTDAASVHAGNLPMTFDSQLTTQFSRNTFPRQLTNSESDTSLLVQCVDVRNRFQSELLELEARHRKKQKRHEDGESKIEQHLHEIKKEENPRYHFSDLESNTGYTNTCLLETDKILQATRSDDNAMLALSPSNRLAGMKYMSAGCHPNSRSFPHKENDSESTMLSTSNKIKLNPVTPEKSHVRDEDQDTKKPVKKVMFENYMDTSSGSSYDMISFLEDVDL
jgi:HSF-type DNA-binding